MKSVATPMVDVRVGDTVCSFGTDQPIGTVTMAEPVGDKIHYKDDGLINSVMFGTDVVLYVIREEA